MRAATAVGASVLAILAAQGLRAQSLPEASQMALDRSWALRADRARQDGAEARLRGAIDSFMPTVGIVADKPLRSRYQYYPEIEPVAVGFGPDSTPRRAPTQLGIVAELPLFDGLRRWNTLQSARTLTEAGRFITLSARQQVLLDTAVAYITVLRDTRILAARDSQVAAITRIRDATEQRYETNDATRTDVALTRSRVQEAQASRDRAIADLAASRLEFKRLVQAEPERMTPPRFPDNLPRDENTFAELVRQANPRLSAARLEADSAASLAEAQAADFLPQVNLQFTRLSQIGYSPALDRITDTTTRLVARVPLYEPGAFPRLAEASAAARQRVYEVQDSELSTVTAARAAFVRRRVIGDQLARLTTRIGELRETMKGFEIERGAGFRTVLDELNIRAELADAEVAAASVQTERDAQSLQLAAAVNRLEVGSSVPASKRFEAIVAAPSVSRLALRRTLHDGRPAQAAKAAQAKVAQAQVAEKAPARASQPVLHVSRADVPELRLR